MMHSGCYGDVLRVKILYNKKDSALIQFAESFQAQTGLYSDVYNIVCVYAPMYYKLQKTVRTV